MPQPSEYSLSFSFTDYSTNYPTLQQPGTALDAEFEGVKTTLDQIRTNLALIQRDDGGLANGIVTEDSLSDETAALANAQAEIAAAEAQASAAAAEVSRLAAEAAAAAGTGPAGADGRTILYGTAAPTTEGANGDFYIRTSTSFLYGPKAGGVWPAGTSLVGPTGPTGATGATGSTGAAGSTGATGAAGYNFLAGAGAPSNSLGVNGDYYANTSNGDFYGPKAVGAWGAATANLFVGTATNDNAASGRIGEYIESEVLVGSAVTLTDNVAANVTSISLTAGDWDVQGAVALQGSGSTPTLVVGWASATTASVPTRPNKGGMEYINAQQQGSPTNVLTFGRRFSLATTTTIYLGGLAAFSSGSVIAYGHIGARRAR